MTGQDLLLSLGTWGPWKQAAALLSGALQRRWRSVAFLAIAFAAAGGAAAFLMPRSYSAETRLLVKKNFMMPALASPRRAVPLGAEAPLQSAEEFVFSHRALHALVERKKLVERWDEERAPLQRLKDQVMAWARGPLTPEAKADALVDMLPKKIRVLPQDDIIKVQASWGNPKTVVDVVNGALDAFLDARRKMDVESIADTHAVLEGFTRQARAQVDEQLAMMVRARRAADVRPVPRGRPGVGVMRRSATRHESPGDPLLPLRTELRAAIARRADLEREHASKVAAAEAKLGERRLALTERHPEIQMLQRDLARLNETPAALAAIRQDETRLRAEFLAKGGREEQLSAPEPIVTAREAAPVVDRPEAEAPVRLARAVSASSSRVAGRREDLLPQGDQNAAVDALQQDALAVLASGDVDEVTERLALEDLMTEPDGAEDEDVASYGRAMLKGALDSYQDLRTRLANVHIELETAQAAFNYRYTVTHPAREPKDADSPNVPLLVIGALVAGLVAGFLRALFVELRTLQLLSPVALAAHLGIGPDPVTE